MTNQFTAVFEKRDSQWVAFIEELPGANTQGETLEEARENLIEATQLILQTNRALSEQDLKGRDVIREELEIAA